MTGPRRLWWRQAVADHDAFVLFWNRGGPECHVLHHLQMATEKLGKAYLWRGGPPPRSHAGFAAFVRLLMQIRREDRERVARLFGFARHADFCAWATAALPLAYAVERLSPDLARDGPNPEYPWPHGAPTAAPVDHRFAVWRDLQRGPGRSLLQFVGRAVTEFPRYADV